MAGATARGLASQRTNCRRICLSKLWSMICLNASVSARSAADRFMLWGGIAGTAYNCSSAGKNTQAHSPDLHLPRMRKGQMWGAYRQSRGKRASH